MGNKMNNNHRTESNPKLPTKKKMRSFSRRTASIDNFANIAYDDMTQDPELAKYAQNAIVKVKSDESMDNQNIEKSPYRQINNNKNRNTKKNKADDDEEENMAFNRVKRGHDTSEDTESTTESSDESTDDTDYEDGDTSSVSDEEDEEGSSEESSSDDDDEEDSDESEDGGHADTTTGDFMENFGVNNGIKNPFIDHKKNGKKQLSLKTPVDKLRKSSSKSPKSKSRKSPRKSPKKSPRKTPKKTPKKNGN